MGYFLMDLASIAYLDKFKSYLYYLLDLLLAYKRSNSFTYFYLYTIYLMAFIFSSLIYHA